MWRSTWTFLHLKSLFAIHSQQLVWCCNPLLISIIFIAWASYTFLLFYLVSRAIEIYNFLTNSTSFTVLIGAALILWAHCFSPDHLVSSDRVRQLMVRCGRQLSRKCSSLDGCEYKWNPPCTSANHTSMLSRSSSSYESTSRPSPHSPEMPVLPPSIL